MTDYPIQKIVPADLGLTLLLEAPRPPSELYVRGDSGLLRRLCLAVVGTRNPSGYGVRAAWALSRSLSQSGITVVSGLARGIDTGAHRGALLGPAGTVAVLGHGLDRIYPPENAALAGAILKSGGCLVSEYAPGTPPLRHHFPERNRIIAGLTLGTLVVEAAVKSGSLITARHSLDANREVFVIPGAFDDNGFEGSHRLIQEGAKLVRDVDDIMTELRIAHEAPPVLKAPSRLRRLFESLGGNATLDELFRKTTFSFAELVGFIEEDKARGLIGEVGPQHFVWLEGPL